MKSVKGHIITSQLEQSKDGNEFHFYLTDGKRPFKIIFEQQEHIFFIDQNSNFSPPIKHYTRKSLNFNNFSQSPVDTIYLKFYSDVKIVKEYCETLGIRTYELDIHPVERFLMERFIYSQVEVLGEIKIINEMETFINPQIRPYYGNILFSHLSLDIETGVKGELYSIGLHYKSEREIKKIVLMVGENDDDEYIQFFHDEKELIFRFLQILHQLDPDFIIGWHVVGFDLKFLENKFQKYNIPFNLGRNNQLARLEEKKGSGFFAHIPGRFVIDGPPVLRSAFHKFKNFKLDTVAQEVLGKNKDISSDENKVNEIERRFKEDKISLAKYNLLDCTLVTDIFEKLDLFNLLISRTKITGLLFDKINISTAAFDHIFLPRIHRFKYVAPNKIDIVRDLPSVGGLVFTPKEGRHKNIAIFDFKSLYPSIIRTFNIDPFSRLNGDDKNSITTPCGVKFAKTPQFLAEKIEYLLEQRENAKSCNNQALSQAIKILMNSFYGVMGSSRCRFYHSDLPKAITTTGHWILNTSKSFFENRGHEIVYGDTDSLFVQMHDKKEESCKTLAHELNLFLSQIIKDEFNITSYLECEFEVLLEQIFFSRQRNGNEGAKKKYIGIKNNQLIFKGVEFVRSDWTELAKNFQKELFEKYFSDYPLEDIIKSYIKNLEAGLYDEDLIYKKRLSKDPKEYTKNIPPHIKAALKVNHTGPYRLKEVSYIMTLDGAEPIQNNPTRIDYQHYIEKQLRPIAEDILITQGKSFDSFIVGDQLSFNI